AGPSYLSGVGGLGRLLVVLDLFELGVDHVVVRARLVAGGLGLGFRLAGLVHGLAQLHRSFRERRGLFLDRLRVVAFDHTAQVRDRSFDRARLVGGALVAIVLQRLLGRVDQRFGLVLGLDSLALLLVGFG